MLLASCDLLFIDGARNGPHSVSITATDPAGNVDRTPATRTFTVDLGAEPPDFPRCPLDGNVIIAPGSGETRSGTPFIDLMYGGAGDDVLRGLGDADCLDGAAGADALFGGTGGDFLFGGAGADRLAGEAADDELYGDAGSDRITGGAGRDRIVGGTGNDVLSDSSGRDTFSGGTGIDRIDARDTSRAGRFIPDTVRCGSGRFDVATVDRRDQVAPDCERVRRR